MTEEFKKYDKVRIINNPLYAGETGEIISCNVWRTTAKGSKELPDRVVKEEKECSVKLDSNETQDFSLNELEKLP